MIPVTTQEQSDGNDVRPFAVRRVVVSILIIHTLMLIVTAWLHSPAIDEVGHLPAGLVTWKLGRYDVYSVNPPLMRMTAALPLHLLTYNESWGFIQDQIGSRSEWSIGIAFCSINGERTFALFSIARMACIPFSLLGAWTCFRWSKELFGDSAGLLALVIWCFSPMALGFGAMCVPDIAATALGITFFYSFRTWLRHGTYSQASLTGLWLGLTCLTKMTWVVLAFLLPVLWLLDRKLTGRASSWRELLVIAAVGTFVVNLGYEFQGTCTPLGQYEFISTALSGEESSGGNRFRGTVLGYVPIPLPYQYLAGIDVQKGDFERGYRSFLHGEWKHGGWWYYYAYATLIKTPIAAFVLTLLTIGFVICGAQWRRSLADEMLLIVPGALLFLLISSQTGFAHHQRYVFPSFPFWFIWLSRCAHFPVHAGSSVRKATRGVIVVSVLWYVGAAVWYFPHNQGYFNELVGGPAHGDEYLLDSNSDWGQDLLFLKQWVEKHPEATPLHIAYFGLVDPQIAGIKYTLPPSGRLPTLPTVTPDSADESLPEIVDELLTSGFDSDSTPNAALDPRVAGGPKPGYYAISAAYLRGSKFAMADGRGGIWSADQPHFTYFDQLTPIARAGYSIRIYHVTPADANALRRNLGWAALPKTPANSPADSPPDASKDDVP